MSPVPVFPLPETVLFPGVTLPLHLFEPRYRQMGEDVVDGDGRLVLVLLKTGWERCYEGTPPVHEVATLGQVDDHERLPDGRLNILLRGVQRVRLLEPDGGVELAPGKLYRVRRVVPSPEHRSDDGDLDRRLLARWRDLLAHSGAESDGSVEASGPAERANRIASRLGVPAGVKQRLLEEDDLSRRGERLIEVIDGELRFWRTLSRYRKLKPEDPSVN